MSRDTYHPGKVPKVLRCNAGLYDASLYKNLGNGARMKFLWAGSGTVSGSAATVIVSGTPWKISPGGKYKTFPASGTRLQPGGADDYGRDMDEAMVVVTPTTTVSGRLYVVKNSSAETISVKSTSVESTAVTFDYIVFTV